MASLDCFLTYLLGLENLKRIKIMKREVELNPHLLVSRLPQASQVSKTQWTWRVQKSSSFGNNGTINLPCAPPPIPPLTSFCYLWWTSFEFQAHQYWISFAITSLLLGSLITLSPNQEEKKGKKDINSEGKR